ncbi:hypothetical protein [Pseudomonas sp. nanlin1]|uniref:hypothetical protein n=1 Tax=Pseudomonas sp. nanlin1 TaxID=3040605 RepID=UPI00388E93C9
MSLPAFFLNVVVCTSPNLETCMPPQFVWAEDKSVPETKRVANCQARAQELNAAREDKSMHYRCEAQRGA